MAAASGGTCADAQRRSVLTRFRVVVLDCSIMRCVVHILSRLRLALMVILSVILLSPVAIASPVVSTSVKNGVPGSVMRLLSPRPLASSLLLMMRHTFHLQRMRMVVFPVSLVRLISNYSLNVSGLISVLDCVSSLDQNMARLPKDHTIMVFCGISPQRPSMLMSSRISGEMVSFLSVSSVSSVPTMPLSIMSSVKSSKESVRISPLCPGAQVLVDSTQNVTQIGSISMPLPQSRAKVKRSRFRAIIKNSVSQKTLKSKGSSSTSTARTGVISSNVDSVMVKN